MAFSATAQAASQSARVRGDYRLAWVALVSWGAILLVMATSPPLVLQAVVWGSVTGVAIWLRQLRTLSPLVAATLALSGVMLASYALHDHLRNPAILESSAGQTIDVVVEVTETVMPDARHLTGVIVSVGDRGVPRVPVMLFGHDAGERHPLGTRFQASVRVEKAERWDGRGWVGFVSNSQVVRQAPALFSGADRLREAFVERSLARGGDAGALLPGLSLGDTSGVPDDLEEDMRRAALAHLVAVSGANCALVVALVVWVTGAAGGSVRLRVLTGTLALIGFVILVTPEPSVMRASVMAIVVLFATALGRPFHGIPVLGLVVWVLLLLDPWRAIDFAFVLSVAATAGILLGYQFFAGALQSLMPTWLAYFVALPISAQVAVQPIIILLRPTLPVWGIVANVLAAPAAPLVTLCGLLGSLMGGLWAPVADFFTWLGWFPAAWIAAIARAVSLSPIVEIGWIPGLAGAISLACVTAMVVGALLAGRPLLWWVGAASILVAGFLSSSLPQFMASMRVPPGWSLAQCDVGQGDAVIYQTSSETVVIDTGDDPEAMERCLQLLRIRHVDYLVLTHFDRDHVGASAVFEGRATHVLSGPPDNDEDRERLQRLESSGAHVVQVRAGDEVTLTGASLRVLWPTVQPLAEPGNASSVVVAITPTRTCDTCVSVIALGDIGQSSQRMLADRLGVESFDAVKVSHHGSSDQYAQLYQLLRTRIALIGVGENNGYGHPAPSILTTLTQTGHTIIRSDLHGTAVVTREGGQFQIWSERAG